MYVLCVNGSASGKVLTSWLRSVICCLKCLQFRRFSEWLEKETSSAVWFSHSQAFSFLFAASSALRRTLIAAVTRKLPSPLLRLLSKQIISLRDSPVNSLPSALVSSVFMHNTKRPKIIHFGDLVCAVASGARPLVGDHPMLVLPPSRAFLMRVCFFYLFLRQLDCLTSLKHLVFHCLAEIELFHSAFLFFTSFSCCFELFSWAWSDFLSTFFLLHKHKRHFSSRLLEKFFFKLPASTSETKIFFYQKSELSRSFTSF